MNENVQSNIAVAGMSTTLVEQSSNTLVSLKKSRIVIKGKITRAATWISSIETMDDLTVDDLEHRLSILHQVYDEFDKLQAQVELLSDDLDECALQRSQVEENYFNTVSMYKKFIRSVSNTPAPPVVSQPPSELEANSGNAFSSLNQPTVPPGHPTVALPDIRLPSISLPIFSGEVEEYLSFSELFRAIIDGSPNLTNTAKMYYLKSSLKGNAAQVIRSLQATGDNYSTAWTLLNERYLCKGTVIERLHAELLGLPPLHTDNASALRKLYDNILRILRSLKALNTIQSQGDSVYVTIIMSKLDIESKKAFRMQIGDANYVPSLDELQTFLSKRLQVLESLYSKKETGRQVNSLPSTVKRTSHPRQSNSSQPRREQHQPNNRHLHANIQHRFNNQQTNAYMSCLLCKSNSHRLPQCRQYVQMSVDDRIKCIQSFALCYNCLSPSHSLVSCKSRFACVHCSSRHHTSIHRHPPRRENQEAADPIPSSSHTTTPPVTLFNHQVNMGQVILGTANILLIDKRGIPQPARALLDSGSQGNLITRQCAQRLQLTAVPSDMKISGVGNSKVNVSKRVFSQIKTSASRYSHNTEFLMVPTITTLLPTAKIDSRGWYIPEHVHLADADFDEPKPIDVLLGAEIFFSILEGQKIPGNANQPTLIKTKLGWVFGGNIPQPARNKSRHIFLSLTEQVERFWNLEQCSSAPTLTPEELECEKHFVDTHARAQDGRYIVHLPKRKDPSNLGHSRTQARRRWLSVESRLSKDDDLRKSYHDFMSAYLKLGHMSLVGPENEVPDQKGHYYIPHHPVIKEHSTSTKVRVVYDASMMTTNSVSLNDILSVGPTVQADLFDILLRFRKHCFVFQADVEKMYRQVLVQEPDRKLQLIFWRASTTDPLYIYQLNTVTYGTGPAPYLATRSLNQLAHDEREKFPRAAATVLENFYVDDVLTGHDNLQIALQLQQELIELLSHGGFPLRKFASNHPALLESIQEEHREKLFSLSMASSDAIKTLGLNWIPDQDIFLYDASKLLNATANTKRQILSQLASLFDPLGVLGPIVCSAKIFMQELWKLQAGWDDDLPPPLIEKWSNFNQSLKDLSTIRIPRFASSDNAQTYELHGYSDASESAYGCAIYLRTRNSDNMYASRLLCAKSRVAPIKSVTLPRLELSAALLLVRLMKVVSAALKICESQTFCYSDSKIVLSWISSPPHVWKTFVANRVAEIQECDSTWKYVQSDQNPADLISRGATVSQLKNSQMWWEGPTFLYEDESPFCSEVNTEDQVEVPEKRKLKTVTMIATNITNDLFKRFSALHTLINVTAWIYRFTNNSRKFNVQNTKELSPLERKNALSCLLRIAQSESLSTELSSMACKGHVPKKSKLRPLAPFVDEGGLLRVGGRLKNSCLSETRRHPIILAPGHPLTTLLITQAHLQCLHGGAQLVLTTLRHKYWIINGKQIIRKLLHKCIPCFKARPANQSPMMGQLSTIRTTPARPFFNTGVDFAGPFLLKSPTRSTTKLKYYVAVFVCMSTKAIHLELVGSLTTENFLAVLKRFVSRRGLCQTISCDNATNFVGARNTLKEIYQFLRKEQSAISHYMLNHQTTWNFIPPLTPYWGGIWEAGVKSMKYHLKRVAALAFLTYEEFQTVLCAIEACLNSRPLTALSSDPSDFEALTPGHFLIGAPLLAMPELDHTEQPLPRLTRWHRTQAITQQFWKRWSAEYVSSLTPLSKWTEETTPLTVDTLVLIKDDHAPPLHWKLGRIIEIHPGKDNVARVATVKTASGTITRSTHKLFPLPIEHSA